MTDLQVRQAIDRFITEKGSPLKGCAPYFWILGRWHGIDGRLAVAIGWAETQLATDPNMSPADITGHNAWGYGHPPGAKHGHQFPSWEEGVSGVTGWLADEYVHKGFNTVAKIEPKWVGSPSPRWTENVSTIMHALGGDPNRLTCPKLPRK